MARFEAVADEIRRYHLGKEKKDTHMDHNVILATIYGPPVTVGLVLVIMWGMSNAGSNRKAYGQDESEQIHSREV